MPSMRPTSSAADPVDRILREQARTCYEGSLVFQAKDEGAAYCCLFLQECEYTHTCPYADGETVYITDVGMNTQRHKCTRLRSDREQPCAVGS